MYRPSMPTHAPVDSAQLLQCFQAVAEETRFRIVQILSAGERCVCDLQGDLGAAQSRLSFHLRKLKEAGVVDDRREGRWVYYSLRPEALEEMRGFLGEVTTGEGTRWLPVLRGGPACGPGEDDGEGCCG
jgi:ArsR family transcriptional regulator, arsenate/arsenite/antimonite-responsive transcriptional repressor